MSHEQDDMGVEAILRFRDELTACRDAGSVQLRFRAWIDDIGKGALSPVDAIELRKDVCAEAAHRLQELGDVTGAVAAALAWSFWSTRATYGGSTPDRSLPSLSALGVTPPPPTSSTQWKRGQLAAPPMAGQQSAPPPSGALSREPPVPSRQTASRGRPAGGLLADRRIGTPLAPPTAPATAVHDPPSPLRPSNEEES